MRTLRALEAVCGVVAGILGAATLVYVLFILPAVAGSGTTCDSTGHCVDHQLPNKSIAENQGVASLMPVIVVGMLLFVAILAGAVWDGVRGVSASTPVDRYRAPHRGHLPGDPEHRPVLHACLAAGGRSLTAGAREWPRPPDRHGLAPGRALWRATMQYESMGDLAEQARSRDDAGERSRAAE